MAKRRDTYNYDLMLGNRIVYRGITNDPNARWLEHIDDGKVFDRLRVNGRPKTREGARATEIEHLHRYRRWHGGENPLYNKKWNG